MANTSNPLPNDPLLKNNTTLTNRYGTIPEQPRETHTQLEYGQSFLTKPIVGCATLCENISSPTTLVVKNIGSAARDYCAIERNFLAWLRLTTILVLVGMSYYFRLDIIVPSVPPVPAPTPTPPVPVSVPEPAPPTLLDRYEKFLGLILIIVGHIALLWALSNYFQFQNKLASRRVVVEHGKLAFFVVSFVGVSVFLVFLLTIWKDWQEEDKVEGEEFESKSSFLGWIFTLLWDDKFIFG